MFKPFVIYLFTRRESPQILSLLLWAAVDGWPVNEWRHLVDLLAGAEGAPGAGGGGGSGDERSYNVTVGLEGLLNSD